jgi:hypothetical protein
MHYKSLTMFKKEFNPNNFTSNTLKSLILRFAQDMNLSECCVNFKNVRGHWVANFFTIKAIYIGGFMSLILALLFSANVQAADYSASCQPQANGEFCSVAVFSCSDVDQNLADEVCHSRGWATGTLDPHNELIGEDFDKCAENPGGPYTYVGCSN